MAEEYLDAVHEVATLDDEECDELRGVYLAAAELAEVSAFVEQLLCQLVHVGYLGHGDDGEASQVAVHEHGLCVGVADDADACLALELVQLGLEACAEVCVLEVVDAAQEFARITERGHAATFRAKM